MALTSLSSLATLARAGGDVQPVGYGMAIPNGDRGECSPIWDDSWLPCLGDRGVERVFEVDTELAPDEIYITYNEGERNVVTTGSIPAYRESVWGERGTVEWVNAADDAGVVLDHPGNGSRGRHRSGTVRDPRGHGGGAHPASGVRDRPDWGGVSQRKPVRGHRHCPGCVGHGCLDRWWTVFWRVLFAFGFGWITVHSVAPGVDPRNYALAATSGALAWALWKEGWRRNYERDN